MGNLISVKRPDKNGKLVTRHVRSEAPSLQQKAIPAPSSPAPVDASGTAPVSEDELIRGLSTVEAKVRLTKDIRSNLAGIGTHSPEGFREVVEEFSTASAYKASLWADMMNWPYKDTARFANALLIELSIMETIAELHPDPRPKDVSAKPSIGRGRALWGASRLSVFRDKTPRTVGQRKAIAFALWAKRLQSESDRIDLDKEIDNINYIAENLDAVMANRNVILQRSNIDREFIESVITTNAPAISEGVL